VQALANNRGLADDLVIVTIAAGPTFAPNRYTIPRMDESTELGRENSCFVIGLIGDKLAAEGTEERTRYERALVARISSGEFFAEAEHATGQGWLEKGREGTNGQNSQSGDRGFESPMRYQKH